MSFPQYKSGANFKCDKFLPRLYLGGRGKGRWRGHAPHETNKNQPIGKKIKPEQERPNQNQMEIVEFEIVRDWLGRTEPDRELWLVPAA